MLRSLDPEKGYQPKDKKAMDKGELNYLDKFARREYERKLLMKVETEFLLGNNSIAGISKKIGEPEYEISRAVTVLAGRSASAVNRGRVEQ